MLFSFLIRCAGPKSFSEASEERLIREIMTVDEVEWEEGKAKFNEIDAANSSGMMLSTLPYKVRHLF